MNRSPVLKKHRSRLGLSAAVLGLSLMVTTSAALAQSANIIGAGVTAVQPSGVNPLTTTMPSTPPTLTQPLQVPTYPTSAPLPKEPAPAAAAVPAR